MSAKRMIWRRCPESRGLYGMMHNSSRGWELRRGTERIANVGQCRDEGYFWSAPSRAEWAVRNTAGEGRFFATPEDAKADCIAWVRVMMEKAKEAEKGPTP